MKRAVIFDFDGLMVDTESPAFDAWSAIYREHGVSLALEEWVACVGASNAHFDPVTRLQELTGRSFDRDTLMADKDRRKAERCQSEPLRPGALERIAEAEELGWALGVASSSGRVWVETHLERLGIRGRFGALVTRELVERVKPAPDLFLACSERLSVAPEHCLVLEDSLNGVLAAKAAGMAVIAVPGPITAALDFSAAHALYPSLEEVRLAEFFSSPGRRSW